MILTKEQFVATTAAFFNADPSAFVVVEREYRVYHARKGALDVHFVKGKWKVSFGFVIGEGISLEEASIDAFKGLAERGWPWAADDEE